MIEKIEGTKNGWRLTAGANNTEWQELLNYYKSKGPVRCIICNYKTSLLFRPSLVSFGKGSLTVNNKLPDMDVYINSIA